MQKLLLFFPKTAVLNKVFFYAKYLIINGFLSGLLLQSAYAAEVSVQVTNQSGGALENAVVYLEPQNKMTTPAGATTAVAQKNKMFVPLVSVIQTGSSVTFPNQDSVRHHVYSFSPAKTFELKLYSGVPSNPVVFDKAGTVVLGCNIHDNMLAYVLVVDTPYFAKTEADGRVKLSNLPNGQYQLKVWHAALKKENTPTEQTITVKESQNFAVKLDTK